MENMSMINVDEIKNACMGEAAFLPVSIPNCISVNVPMTVIGLTD